MPHRWRLFTPIMDFLPDDLARRSTTDIRKSSALCGKQRRTHEVRNVPSTLRMTSVCLNCSAGPKISVAPPIATVLRRWKRRNERDWTRAYKPVDGLKRSRAFRAYEKDGSAAEKGILADNRSAMVERLTDKSIDPKTLVLVTHQRMGAYQ